MQDKLIELKDINMHFQKASGIFSKEKDYHVLKDVNLAIEQGEILVIVGESGCGKTTMGKIITGLLRPTSGDLFFQGKPVYSRFKTGHEVFRRSVQFIQQDSYAALNPVKTIYQSLAAPIKAVDKKLTRVQVEMRMAEVLTEVGLTPVEQFMYKYPHQLSGGQRQRVLISRALTQNPKLIVADEPVSMIDVSLRLSILDLMTRLNTEKNISFVYITHDLGTARYFANVGRIGVMYLGEIVELSLMSGFTDSPRHPYSQALLSAVPIADPRIARIKDDVKIRSMELMSLEHRLDGCSFYDRCLYRTEGCAQGEIQNVTIGDSLVKCRNLDAVPCYQRGY